MATELEVALARESAPAELPIGLPLAHLTARRWLQSILNAGQLEPRPCKVLSKTVLYFSYGGVFYRTSTLQTECTSELPVGLVFSPNMMNAISKLFPFDSGAAADNRFGPDWSRRLAPFASRFSVSTTDALRDARRLVYHLFESNPRYLGGRPSPSGKLKQDPFPLLHEFLSCDLSSLNVDHRQRTIEAISEVAIELGRHLLWIGIPQFRTSSVLKELHRWTAPNVLPFYTYDYTKNFNPSEMAARLEENAQECIIKRYASFPV
jgi:hypothetical protein